MIVHFNSRRSEADSILNEIRAFGADSEIVQADLATSEGPRHLASFAAGRPIDILVNNADSLVARTRVLDFTEDLWEKVMMLNLTSAFFPIPGRSSRHVGTKAWLHREHLFGGRSVRRRPWVLAYFSAKAAVSTMTKSLTKEFAPQGIRVNCVSPGTIDTEYHKTFSTAEGLDGVHAATPAGRLGTSEQIADAVVFLCSDQASFIHGQAIEINGGFLMA